MAYWITTGLFCAFFALSGFGYVAGAEAIVEGLKHLGYPDYFRYILGPCKLLGVVVLLVPGRPLLKEWAYCGFTIDLSAAFATHVFMSDPIVPDTLAPLVFLALGAGSYFTRPADRRL